MPCDAPISTDFKTQTPPSSNPSLNATYRSAPIKPSYDSSVLKVPAANQARRVLKLNAIVSKFPLPCVLCELQDGAEDV